MEHFGFCIHRIKKKKKLHCFGFGRVFGGLFYFVVWGFFSRRLVGMVIFGPETIYEVLCKVRTYFLLLL